MISGCQADGHSQFLHASPQYLWCELGSPVIHSILWDTSVSGWRSIQSQTFGLRHGWSFTVSKVEGSLGRWSSRRDFEKPSITIMTVLPWDGGWSVMRSMAMWDQCHYSVDKGSSFSVGKVRGTVAWTQDEHDKINLCILWNIQGHQYLFRRSWWVLWVGGDQWQMYVAPIKHDFGKISPNRCESVSLTPFSEAFTSTMKGFEVSGCLRMGTVMKASLSLKTQFAERFHWSFLGSFLTARSGVKLCCWNP